MKRGRNRHHHHNKKHHVHHKHRKINPVKSFLIILCRILQGGVVLSAGMVAISRIMAMVNFIQLQYAISTPVTQGAFMSTKLLVIAGYLGQSLLALIIGIIAILIIEYFVKIIKEWR
jgi:uncharacterized membrane protein